MNEDKFKILIDNFSPSLLAETFQRSHDFFRIKQNLLPAFSDKQFADFSQLGDFELEDNTSVVVICARSLTHLNERASRKAQYDISKKILKSFQTSRAGIFVYYDSKGDFRISLIYADYVGIRVNYSTFRRFTYFVSKQQANTTFLQQVGKFDFTNFQELKELFSVEKVTKEFFKKYRDLFIELLEDFEKNIEFQNAVVQKNISTSPDFVKKLMGQVVFLYFVQKKGWLGVRPNENWGTGNQAFLRFLFEDCKKANKNYFNDYLEPLFYKALAEKRGDDDYFEELNCRIPFLNGGLFESVYDWKKTNIDIPNKTTGKLLDFFDQYNFTVDENTPSDQEISIDPEMLGKIFENLLDVKNRKDKGAFYTPREIVHYMCRESLIQHLVSENTAPEERIRKIFEIKDTDLSVLIDGDKKTETIKKMQELKDIAEKVDLSLRDIKIVDPAVGSGAFPMGMLNEISSVRYYLNSNFLHKLNVGGKELSLYDIKKETLENCIYAVDIEPGAVEIAKLRFWLALVVEYESNDSNIAPPTLPNLDYKIMQGNSLLEEYEGVKLFDENIIRTVDTSKEKLIEDIKKKQSTLQKEYFGLHSKNKLTAVKKIELDTEAKKLNEQLKKLSQVEKNDVEKLGLFDLNKNNESKLKADELKSLQKQFFETNRKDKKESIKKQIEKLEWELIEATLKEEGKISELNKIAEFKKAKAKPFFLWKLHFADVFDKGGFDIVIGNPPYVRVDELDVTLKDSYKKIYQSTKGKYDLYYLFFELGELFLKKKGVLCYITPNKYCAAESAGPLRDILLKNKLEIVSTSMLKVFDSASNYPVITIVNKNTTNSELLFREALTIDNITSSTTNHYILSKNDIELLPNKIIPINVSQLEVSLILRLLNNQKYLGEIIDFSEGLRIKSEYESQEKNDFSVVKQFQFEKWSPIREGSYISKENLAKTLSEKSDRFKKTMCEKILVAEDALEISATLDTTKHIPQGGIYFGTAKDNLFVLGLLNSKLFSKMYKILFGGMHMGGGYLRYRKTFLESLPILSFKKDDIEIIHNLVDLTLNQVPNTSVEETTQILNKIDNKIAKIYALSPEEIEIVENSSKK